MLFDAFQLHCFGLTINGVKFKVLCGPSVGLHRICVLGKPD